MNKKIIPIVYSCSGCSSAAQLANYVAVQLDRKGVAEMSCIAGVGGGVSPLVKKAQSGRPIVAIDGCPLKCVMHCLDRHGVRPNRHLVLSEWGIKKVMHQDFHPDDARDVLDKVTQISEDLQSQPLEESII